MQKKNDLSISFPKGVIVSFGLHLVLALVSIIALERTAATAIQAGEIFTVTLEGGEQLGGIGQVPKDGQKKVLTKQEEVEEPQEKAEEKTEKVEKTSKQEKVEVTKEEHHLEEPAVVDDPEKILAQKKLEEEKKLKEKKAKEEAEKKKKQEEEKKKKEQEEKKKEEEEKKQKEKEDADKKKEREKRDKQLADTLKKLKNQYDGESADAGGKGFGAAALGGKGMGGGTLDSLERVAYRNALQKHVKAGWHWLGGTEKLVARVSVYILPNGEVQKVEIAQSSGNSNFDDSVVRAVLKASPVPAAPESIYPDFAKVGFAFDSTE